MIPKNEYTLGEALSLLFKELKLEEKLFEQQIRQHWAQWFGPAFGKYTHSIRLRHQKLHLHITSAPLRQEIWFRKDQLMQRINEALSAQAVKEVVVY
ncbi:MAG: DUF721 domain-containing protein [Chitinophagales bacterium]|nr:DUF721 domain-containing protein [Chitinophagales bacterium]MDW8393714.1 DUF721 domain-containing protein [Chitinophagales bacterium]